MRGGSNLDAMGPAHAPQPFVVVTFRLRWVYDELDLQNWATSAFTFGRKL